MCMCFCIAMIQLLSSVFGSYLYCTSFHWVVHCLYFICVHPIICCWPISFCMVWNWCWGVWSLVAEGLCFLVMMYLVVCGVWDPFCAFCIPAISVALRSTSVLCCVCMPWSVGRFRPLYDNMGTELLAMGYMVLLGPVIIRGWLWLGIFVLGMFVVWVVCHVGPNLLFAILIFPFEFTFHFLPKVV